MNPTLLAVCKRYFKHANLFESNNRQLFPFACGFSNVNFCSTSLRVIRLLLFTFQLGRNHLGFGRRVKHKLCSWQTGKTKGKQKADVGTWLHMLHVRLSTRTHVFACRKCFALCIWLGLENVVMLVSSPELITLATYYREGEAIHV